MSFEQKLVLLKIAGGLLAIMATYSLAGLIAVWGAQGRGHWFLRMAAVLAFPAAWLLTVDRRLCLFFLSQMAVVVLRLWHFQSRRSSTADGPGPAAAGSSANESRRRYSLAEMLLVFVLLSGVLAMLARMPPQVRRDWHLDALPGFAMGVFTLVAVWAAQSRRSAWLRAAALMVAFPALLMGSWLWLARSARSARGPIGRVAAVACIILMAVPPAMIYVEEFRLHSLAYPPPLANNGYVDLLRAAEAIDDHSVKVDALSGDELRAYLVKQEPALELARQALTRPCQVVLYDRMDDMRLMLEGQSLEKLSQIFAARGRQQLLDGRLGEAVESYVAAIDFGAAIANGGVMIHEGSSFTAERLGIEGLQKIVAGLDDDACCELIERFAAIDARHEPAGNVIARERVYYARAYPWKHRANTLSRALFPIGPTYDDLMDAAAGEKRARLRLLVCHLALRRHWLATNRFPDSLDALVPRYLASVPLDSFADRALTYKKLPANYLLYSIGSDLIDDSGAPCAPLAWPVPEGDIVVPVDLPPAGDAADTGVKAEE